MVENVIMSVTSCAIVYATFGVIYARKLSRDAFISVWITKLLESEHICSVSLTYLNYNVLFYLTINLAITQPFNASAVVCCYMHQGLILPMSEFRKFSVFGTENFVSYRGNIIDSKLKFIWSF